MSIFTFADGDSLGKVSSVDTGNVIVTVDNEALLKKLQVNRLVALHSSKSGEYLIGLIQQVVRKRVELVEEEQDFLVDNFCKISLVGTLKDRDGLKKDVFVRSLETVPEIDAKCFSIEAESLTAFMNVVSHGADEKALRLGHYTLSDRAPAYINGNKFFQRHAFIGGSTGAGKSYTTAKIVEQTAALGEANAILFDLHGEYHPLDCEGISHYKIAGPADIDAGTSLQDGVIHLPYWLLSYDALVSFLVDRSDSNAPNQAMLVSREVNKLKREYLENINAKDVLSNFTIDSPIPFDIDELVSRLDGWNTEQVPGARANSMVKGDFNGKLSRMLARLEAKVADRRLGFMFQGGAGTNKFDWLHELAKVLIGTSGENGRGGIKIIDFSEVPSDVLPLIVSLMARLAFSIQQWTSSEERHPIALLCDEAHLYMPERVSADSSGAVSIQIFERIAKEGRKYGVSLVVISQRPSEVNKTLMSQCSNFIAMRLTNAEDQSVIKRLLPDTLGRFSDVLPVLDVGEALVVGDASLLPSRIKIEKPTKEPDSGTVAFWDKWQEKAFSQRIVNAVDNWRKQNIS